MDQRKMTWIALGVLVLAAVFVFGDGLFSDKHIISLDNKPGEARVYNKALAGQFGTRGWNSLPVAGMPSILPYSLYYFTRLVFPPVSYLKFTYFLGILLAGIFFFLWMRSHGLAVLSSLFGGLAFMLTNSILTLVYPGHLGKIASLAWIPLVFLFLRKGVVGGKLRHYLLAGLFLGMSAHGQGFQMTLYFGLLALFYFFYLVLRQRDAGQKLLDYLKHSGTRLAAQLGRLVVMGLMIVLMLGILIPSLQRQMAVRSDSSPTGMRGEQQKWNFATQWSLPPEEILDFFVPGLFGWLSANPANQQPEYPYWGRMGQPAGGRGNYKLNSENIGVITVLLLVFALLMGRGRRDNENGFWLWALIIALLLALGRHLYLPYYLFFKLPFMSSLRNPNKFIKIIAFAAAVLAAYGFDYLFARRELLEKAKQVFQKRAALFQRIVLIVMALFLLLSFLLAVGGKDLLGRDLLRFMQQQTGNNRAGIRNVIGYMPLAFLIAAMFCGVVYYVFNKMLGNKVKPPLMTVLPWILIAGVGLELWLSARHFVVHQKQPNRYSKDAIISIIERHKKPVRVMFYGQGPFYTEKFNYYQINSVSFRKLAQGTGRYQDLLQVAKQNLWRIVDLLNVNILFSVNALDKPGLRQLQAFPLRGNRYLYVYDKTNAVPRTYLAPAHRQFGSLKQVQQYLAATNSYPLQTVALEKDHLPQETLPQTPVASNAQAMADVGSTTLDRYTSREVRITAAAKRPAILVMQDYYHPDWKAMVNGKAAPVFPVNLISRGLIVPAGKSTVVFRYSPDHTFDWLALLAYLIGLVCLVLEWREWKRQQAASGA